MTTQQAIDMLKRLPPDRQRMILSRLPQDRKTEILQTLTHEPTPPSKTQPNTGASFKAPATGIAGLREKLNTFGRNVIGGNLDAIGGTLGGVVGAEGGPPGSVVGAGLGGAAGRGLQQIINAGRGKRMETSLDALEDMGVAGAEQAGSELLGRGVGKLGKMIKPASRAASMAAGTESGQIGRQAFERIIPELDKTIGSGAAPKTIGQFTDLVDRTEHGLNAEFNAALLPINNVRLGPNSALGIGRAIVDKITPDMANSPEGRQAQNYLYRRALRYQNQVWTVEQLNARRITLNKELAAYKKAISTTQSAMSRTNAVVAANEAEEGALKDLLYDVADRVSGNNQGYFRALKQKQSDLLNLQKAIEEARPRLEKASLESEGAPMIDKIHIRGYLHPKTGVPGGVAGLNPHTFHDPILEGNKAIQKAFPSTAQKVTRGARSAISGATSRASLNAVPLRVLLNQMFGMEIADDQEAGKE